MRYVGVDLHKHYCMVTQMDEKGKSLVQVRLENKEEVLRNYFGQLKGNVKIAVEATGNWYHFYETLEDDSREIYLCHPQKTKAIASAKIKTDKIDSKILADLLRCNLLPTSYIPDRKTRDEREILRYRASLVNLRIQLKCKVHTILEKNGIRPPQSDIFTKKGTEYLKRLNLREVYKKELLGYLELIEEIDKKVKEVTEEIKQRTKDEPKALLLMSIPGISYYSALLLLAEIGEIERFPSAAHLCSYGGLVPSVHSSGGKTHYGSITKQGSKWIRWILTEVALHAVKGTRRFSSLYNRVSKKHGSNAGKIAVAREMLKCIYYMLKKNELFKDLEIKNSPAISSVS